MRREANSDTESGELGGTRWPASLFRKEGVRFDIGQTHWPARTFASVAVKRRRILRGCCTPTGLLAREERTCLHSANPLRYNGLIFKPSSVTVVTDRTMSCTGGRHQAYDNGKSTRRPTVTTDVLSGCACTNGSVFGFVRKCVDRAVSWLSDV